MDSLPVIALVAGVIAIYFLPTIIVLARGRNDGCGIFAVNLIFGGTGIGWIVALIWSLTGDGRGSRERLR